jgi:hypothetical protein
MGTVEMRRGALAVGMLIAVGIQSADAMAADGAEASAQASTEASAEASAAINLEEKRDAVTSEPTTDCAFGLATFCLARSERNTNPDRPRFRAEVFGGYKFSNMYYREEIRACNGAGCTIDFQGAAFGADAYVNLRGNPRSDDYFSIGLATGYVPVVSALRNNEKGFRGELGNVAPGDGSLGYVPLRIALRRSNFLYLIQSKYLVSSFGVGLAFPVSQGAGASFTGSDGPKITLGGKLGAEVPLGERFRIGAATHWSVIWYGSTFGEASFLSSYGAHLTTLL